MVVGAHIFYRWAGGWGRPPAFVHRYAQREPDSQALRTAAAAASQKSEAQEEIAEIPGAELLPDGARKKVDGKVAIRFNLEARKAVEAAPRVPYVEKVAVSDNLRWSLSKSLVDSEAEPLGRRKLDIGGDKPAVSGGAAPN